MENHKHFGNIRLGSLVDCFGSIDDAAEVVCGAAKYLEAQNVDLIVSNQLHAAWDTGLHQAGFFRGPSNFLFAASRELADLLDRKNVPKNALHLNRGDGDGPINL